MIVKYLCPICGKIETGHLLHKDEQKGTVKVQGHFVNFPISFNITRLIQDNQFRLF